MINEPAGDEDENIIPLSGVGCEAVAHGDAGGVRYCGSVLQARTSRPVASGEELRWCYGEGYQREYEEGRRCSGVQGESGSTDLSSLD